MCLPCVMVPVFLVQNNRMDTDSEYVEVFDDDDDLGVPTSKPRAKQPSQLRRYKDDAYRCSPRAAGLLLACCCMRFEGSCGDRPGMCSLCIASTFRQCTRLCVVLSMHPRDLSCYPASFPLPSVQLLTPEALTNHTMLSLTPSKCSRVVHTGHKWHLQDTARLCLGAYMTHQLS